MPGYISNYGGVWGLIPNTAGRVFWVAPSASYTVDGRTYIASDNNNGLTPEQAFLTLDRCFDTGKVTASVGDVIVLLPGAHSWSASVAADVAGVTIMGLPTGKGHPTRMRTSITTSAADQIINVTVADVEMAYLHVIPVTATAGIDMTSAADRLYVHDCTFDLFTPAASTSTKGVSVTAVGQSPDDVVIQNCYFLSDGAQGPGVELGDTFQAVVEDCTFEVRGGAWASALSMVGVTSQSGLVRNCYFRANQGTMTVGILGGTDDASTGRTSIYNCFFDENVTKPIEDFGVENANIAENYRASAAGAAEGGLLWSSTT